MSRRHDHLWRVTPFFDLRCLVCGLTWHGAIPAKLETSRRRRARARMLQRFLGDAVLPASLELAATMRNIDVFAVHPKLFAGPPMSGLYARWLQEQGRPFGTSYLRRGIKGRILPDGSVELTDPGTDEP